MMSWHSNCTKQIMAREIVLALLLGLLATPAMAAVFSSGLADPTRPPGSGGGEYVAPTSGVTAIRISGSQRLAVIDGQTLKVGDRYRDGHITAIHPYEVIVERAGRTTSLRLVPKLEKDQRP